MSTRIKVESDGEISIFRTEANILADLWTEEFKQDFNISERAIPLVNGVEATLSTEIQEDDTVSYQLTKTSKS